MVNDPTNPDFGKIAPQFFPGSHPPIESTPVQSYAFDGLVTDVANVGTSHLYPADILAYNEPLTPPVTAARLVGKLYQSAVSESNFTQTNYTYLKANIQINFNNLAVQFVGAVGGFVPPLILPIQIILQAPATVGGANGFFKYPIPITTGEATSINIQTAPIGYLTLTGQLDDTITFPHTFYYSGVVTYEDLITKGNYNDLVMYAMFIYNGNLIYPNSVTGEVFAPEVGSMSYNALYTLSD
jgi:hypothetical protein